MSTHIRKFYGWIWQNARKMHVKNTEININTQKHKNQKRASDRKEEPMMKKKTSAE